MAVEKVYISRDGLEKLKDKVRELSESRLAVADSIEYARELGDLKENAEYHAAKEQQGMIQAQIKDLEDKIARAAILEDHDIDDSKAYVGASVTVQNKKTSKKVTYTLVSEVEADLAAGKISVNSPMGKALLGRAVGETVVAKVPAGDLELEILGIER